MNARARKEPSWPAVLVDATQKSGAQEAPATTVDHCIRIRWLPTPPETSSGGWRWRIAESYFIARSVLSARTANLSPLLLLILHHLHHFLVAAISKKTPLRLANFPSSLDNALLAYSLAERLFSTIVRFQAETQENASTRDCITLRRESLRRKSNTARLQISTMLYWLRRECNTWFANVIFAKDVYMIVNRIINFLSGKKNIPPKRITQSMIVSDNYC